MPKPVAAVSMLIRKPARECFDAFVEPRMLEKFWLKSASAPLAAGAVVRWEFLVEGAHDDVTVTAFRRDEHLAFRWSDGVDVTIDFTPHSPGATRVAVKATGFTGDNLIQTAIDTTEGFAIVLCDLKTLLETGASANLVRDKAALIEAGMTSS